MYAYICKQTYVHYIHKYMHTRRHRSHMTETTVSYNAFKTTTMLRPYINRSHYMNE